VLDKLRHVANVQRSILLDRRLAKRFSTRLWMAAIFDKYYMYRAVRPLLRAAYRGQLERLIPQKRLIDSRAFDVLIILDACRWDILGEVVHEYLDGKLYAVRSPASVTIDWLVRTWGDRYWHDIHYISASPMVNKRGIIREFDARRHFRFITEVWDWGWDRTLATVPPEKVNMAVRIARAKMRLRGLRLGRDYRMVIHYVQPHAPYVVFKRILELIERTSLAEDIADIALRREGKLAGKFAIDYVILALLKEHLGDVDKVNDMLRKAYIENLRWVLRYVSKLATTLPGRIAITADHGELLGEYGLYFHMTLPLPQLRVVPWFMVR